MSVHFVFRLKKAPRPENVENGISLQGTNGATVLLIHGLTGTPNEVKSLANYLNKKGYSVVCPRLANHGEPVHILKKTKWPEFYASVRKAFDEITAQSSGPVFAGGLSMGALFALLLAEEFPDKVAGVSCLSPTLFFDGWNVPWTRYLLPLAYSTPLKYIAYFKEDAPYGLKNETIRQRVSEYYSKADLQNLTGVARFGYPYFPVTLFYELDKLIKYTMKKIPKIHVPVQLIQAKDDDMTSPKNSQYIYDHVKSKVKEMVILYDSYHVITGDQEREKVAQAVENFAERVRNHSAVAIG